MWSNYKRYSKRGDQYVLYRKRHKSIVRSEIYLQKMHFYLREDG